MILSIETQSHLNLVDNLPQVHTKKAFIFSTDRAPRKLMEQVMEEIAEKMKFTS